MTCSKKVFPTARVENWHSRFLRLMINFFPAYRGSGGRVAFFASDLKEVHVKVGLTWRTRNYVGTVFGGSMFSAMDPIYMFQLIKILGKDYVVWDKSATISFIRPVKKTVYARFLLTDEFLDELKEHVATNGEYNFTLESELIGGEDGKVYAKSQRQIYLASKEFYKQKQESRKQN
jgi:acyl-coenzyme A thioesterase PaaI-like protein